MLEDQSSKPKSSPHATSPQKVREVLQARIEHRTVPDDLVAHIGIKARTVLRILAAVGMAYLWELDPLAGVRIHTARAIDRGHERHPPGDMIHLDVKKFAGDPGRRGWRAGPAQSARNHTTSHTKVGFDYVHVAVDDRSRLAFVEVHADEKGPTCAGFLTRAAAFMAAHGAPANRVMTDNRFAYRLSKDFRSVLAGLGR